MDEKEKVKTDYLSGIMPKELSKKYDISLNTIKSWIKRYGWSRLKNEGAPSKVEGAPSKRKQGGQPGNKNAAGQFGNQNAAKFGFFSKYLPEETKDIIKDINQKTPLDILWENIQIQYAAIIRAQQIMYVKDKDDLTKTKIEEKHGNVSGKSWEIQQAWDKQANFLKAQSRAFGELRGQIKQYDDLLHKEWELVSDEQKERLALLKAQVEKIRSESGTEDDGKVVIINDV